MKRRQHMRVARILAPLIALITLVSSCSSGSDDLEYLRVVVDGQSTFGVSRKGEAPKAVVIYFHGVDADESVIMDDRHKDFTTTLVNAGYAVVASRAGGNSFGNAASRRNYSELALTARSHFKVNDVYFVAESMGAVAAVDLLAATPDPALRGVVAISPALDLRSAPDQYQSAVQAAYPAESMDAANPMNLPTDQLQDKKIRLYATPSDTLIPTDANTTAFQAKYGFSADISVVLCTGDHVDPSCFRGDDVVTWLDGLASQ